ncbi:MAG: phosphoribosyl-ATP diphosphatase [Alphaproteobacteria bacterium GM7ARS4]|nr:phosphoribosyl-ATP diphosphatase [Alphaproteobacteria bacterium GM7ARS4]
MSVKPNRPTHVPPHVLERLFARIRQRQRHGDTARSYTAQLLAGGRALCVRKLGEEHMEVLLAALTGTKTELTQESADMLYHMLVLWAQCDVEPSAVWETLEQRFARSGLVEKAERTKQ